MKFRYIFKKDFPVIRKCYVILTALFFKKYFLNCVISYQFQFVFQLQQDPNKLTSKWNNDHVFVLSISAAKVSYVPTSSCYAPTSSATLWNLPSCKDEDNTAVCLFQRQRQHYWRWQHYMVPFLPGSHYYVYVFINGS